MFLLPRDLSVPQSFARTSLFTVVGVGNTTNLRYVCEVEISLVPFSEKNL